MKTIEQHEAGRAARLTRQHGPILCGIECPKCGSELWSDPTVRLLTSPARKQVHCHGCNWSGGSVTA